MRYIQSTCIFLGLALGITAVPAAAGELELSYQRAATAEPPSVVRPAPPELPEALRLSATEITESSPGDLDVRAGIAALLSALDRAEGAGRRESYRLGFFEGLKQAGGDPVLGRWDYDQGIRDGSASRWAGELGEDLGTGEARRIAAAAAYGHVTAAFSTGADSGRKPRPVAPPFAASVPDVRSPRVEDLLRETTVVSVLERLPPAGLDTVWERESVLEMHRSRHRDEIYDGRWSEASSAFDEWLLDARNQDGWQRLDPAERSTFRAVFERHYAAHLAHVFSDVGPAAYRDGFDDGWSYGAFVNREWSFRQGFTDAFVATVRETAEASFYERYPSFYGERYEELFRERTVAQVGERRTQVEAGGFSGSSYSAGGDR